MPINQRLVRRAVATGSLLAASLVVTSSPLTPTTSGAAGVSPHQRTNPAVTPHAAVTFSVRLEDQILATLRYLPLKFVLKSTKPTTTTTTTTTTLAPTTTTTAAPSSTTTSTTTTTTTTTTTLPPKAPKAPNPTKLVAGNFVWRFTTLPPVLRSQWRVGTTNVILKGALMDFQSIHDLDVTGANDPETWQELLAAARSHKMDPSTYDYVLVSQTQPEKLKLYVNGRHIYTTYVNTGVSSAPTQNGTWPVYSRFLTTTMSGTLPDGKPYSDPGIPWVSYFNGGDALHGFFRSGYGYPQSLGCVEMPFTNAKVIFPYTPIGTLVTVEQ